MSDIGGMVADLIASGANPEIAARVVTEAFAAGAASIGLVTLSSRDASRSVTMEQARVRAQNYRNRKKIQQVAKANDVATSGEIVTLHAVTRHVTPIARPNNSILLEGLSIGKEEESKKEVVARARGTRLQSGTPLTAEYRNIAIEIGAAPNHIDHLWAEFVDYWCAIPGTRGTKLDWPATWRNRLRQITSKGRPDGRRTVHAAAKDLTQKLLAGFDEPAPSSLCEPESGGAFRLLPTR